MKVFNPFTGTLDEVSDNTSGVSSVNGLTGDVVIAVPENTSDLVNDSGFITVGDIPAETDPVFTASDAFDITATDISNLANLSGTNTGDQVGDGTTITGAGTVGDPFVATGGTPLPDGIILDGGNAFGESIEIGTTDSFSTNIIADDIVRIQVNPDGVVKFIGVTGETTDTLVGIDNGTSDVWGVDGFGNVTQSGKLNDLTIPSSSNDTIARLIDIPTDNTAFSNGAGYITLGEVPAETDPVFSASEAVNFEAGDKSKLDSIASGAEVNVNADWDSVTGDSEILNKPTIPTQYTDEMAQDAVGNAVGNGLDYDDPTGAISVDETELDHNSLGSKQGGTAGEYYHMTSAQATVLGNTSGTNSGNETATTIGALIGGAGDATPNDTDFVATSLTASGILKKITWTNVKAFLKTYFDTLYITVAGFTMTGNITLGENTAVVYDPVLSADGKYTGIVRTGTAGYTQAFGDLVYLDPTDSRWEACDANSAQGADGDSRGIIGMVVSAGTDGNACTVLLHGVIRADAKFPTFTVNNPIYVSETAGSVTQTQPTTTDVVIRIVGFGLTADEMFFNPSNDYTTHT